MSMKVTGFDNLFGTLDSLGNVGKNAGKKAVKEGMKVAVKGLKEEAPRDSGEGADHLKVVSVKTYKSGNTWGKAGIDKTNWDKSGHLWYQNFGYENKGLNFTGQKVTKNVGWMEKAFNKCKNEAEDEIVKSISSELDKILR